eukprot:gene6247-12649_t
MGRYTSLQIYNEQNTKITGGYSTEEGNAAVSSASSSGTNVTALNLAKAVTMTEKVNNVSGSCAGAGSGEFDVYRASRRRELTRLDDLEKVHKKSEEERLFEEKVLRNKMEAKARTKKNAEKRKKKKEKKRKFIVEHREEGVDAKRLRTGSSSGGSSGEEAIYGTAPSNQQRISTNAPNNTMITSSTQQPSTKQSPKYLQYPPHITILKTHHYSPPNILVSLKKMNIPEITTSQSALQRIFPTLAPPSTPSPVTPSQASNTLPTHSHQLPTPPIIHTYASLVIQIRPLETINRSLRLTILTAILQHGGPSGIIALLFHTLFPAPSPTVHSPETRPHNPSHMNTSEIDNDPETVTTTQSNTALVTIETNEPWYLSTPPSLALTTPFITIPVELKSPLPPLTTMPYRLSQLPISGTQPVTDRSRTQQDSKADPKHPLSTPRLYHTHAIRTPHHHHNHHTLHPLLAFTKTITAFPLKDQNQHQPPL